MLSSCTTPRTSQAIVSYFSNLKPINFHAIYEHTMGGIEYDDGGYVEKTKRRKYHINEANQWAMEMPTD